MHKEGCVRLGLCVLVVRWMALEVRDVQLWDIAGLRTGLWDRLWWRPLTHRGCSRPRNGLLGSNGRVVWYA